MQQRVAVLLVMIAAALAPPSSAVAAKTVRQGKVARPDLGPETLSARASALYVTLIHTPAAGEADRVRIGAAISKLTQAERLLDTMRGRRAAERLLTEAEGIVANPSWKPPSPSPPGLVARTKGRISARARSLAARLGLRDRPPVEDLLARREATLYVRLLHDHGIDTETFRQANALRARAATLLGKRFGRGRAEARELLDRAEALIGPP